jgi:hypothetical protein
MRMKSATITLSKNQINTLKRLLTRVTECGEGRCPGHQIQVRYLTRPILDKLEAAKLVETPRPVR